MADPPPSTTTTNLQTQHPLFDMEECRQQWQKWMPMPLQLYHQLRAAQLCMLQKVDELFCEANIPYWICGGTLLGAARHQGFIPHDDDIDIECFEADLPKIGALPLDPPLLSCIDLSPCTWEGQHRMIRLRFWNDLLQLDVFPRPSPLPDGEKYFPSQQEVFPLQRYKFESIVVNGPRSTNYLDRCYGPDWRTTVCVWNHDFNWSVLAGHNPRQEMVPLDQYNQIVTNAIRAAHKPIQAQAASAETRRQCFPTEGDFQQFCSDYQKYQFQRTFRRNRAAAEYRERLAEVAKRKSDVK